MNASFGIGYHETVDLRGDFPISWKYSFRKNIGWLMFFCLVVALYLSAENSSWVADDVAAWMQKLRPAVFKAIAAILLVKLIHSELYRLTFYYGTEGFRLVVSRGIILKQRGSLPLLPISEIYIQRNFVDLFCGICNLNVYTPMDQTRQFARIECLDAMVAIELQHFLNEVLTKQVFFAPQAMEAPLNEEDGGHDQSAPAQDQPAAHHGGHDKGAAQDHAGHGAHADAMDWI